TEDVARETILDAVRTLAQTLNAGVFVIVDAEGHLIADSGAPDASGFDMSDRPVIKKALADGEDAGVWTADGKAYQVSGCRLEYVLLRSIDEALAPARKVVRILLVLVGAAALATLLLALGLARRLSRPIDALVARTAAIARGDLSPKPVAGPTEVEALGVAM